MGLHRAYLVLVICNLAWAGMTINEFHYDNAGTDQGEFVEVATDTTHRTDVLAGQVALHLYNGTGGTEYATHNLIGFDYHGTLSDGMDYYSKSIPNIQNGSPDGMALVLGGMVVEFISYEGSFMATNGPASGMTSIDIGVAESGSTPVGSSLQRIGFSGHWVLTEGTNTRGAVNIPSPGALGLALAGAALGIWSRRA